MGKQEPRMEKVRGRYGGEGVTIGGMEYTRGRGVQEGNSVVERGKHSHLLELVGVVTQQAANLPVQPHIKPSY